ncbi:hypothetical protein [Granulicoccus phenolivorans]|uniref:hypothetical protein n=1 Tax=Granulicoccus phenolivorans TaxID=266854 RepID=UPI000409C25D|nr:hypothetical protein [Granulicoccus phenolivorans]
MNKKAMKLGAAIGGLALAVTMAGAGAAFAAPGNGQGATVQHDAYGAIMCNFLDESGTFWPITDCHVNIVMTPSGKVNETISGTLAPSITPPTRAMRGSTATTGELCDPNSGAVNLDSATLTPSGNFSAKCSD